MLHQPALKDIKTRKLERLEARLTREQKRFIERAANLRGTTVTEFVLASVQRAATETLDEFAALNLRNESCRVFVNALLHPPAPNAAARAAMRRYRQQVVR